MKAIWLSLIFAFLIPAHGISAAETCKPTAPDALGPFYKAGAPVRSSVGKGYVLTGTVRSATDCAPVTGAKVEFWLAGPNEEYGDAYRATLFSDQSGTFRFESHFPPAYYERPSHIHIRVSAHGFLTLVTQHYPVKGKTTGVFDLVIIRDAK
jgi:protocatechuate 3,4-dioxygenase beta subunit